MHPSYAAEQKKKKELLVAWMIPVRVWFILKFLCIVLVRQLLLKVSKSIWNNIFGRETQTKPCFLLTKWEIIELPESLKWPCYSQTPKFSIPVFLKIIEDKFLGLKLHNIFLIHWKMAINIICSLLCKITNSNKRFHGLNPCSWKKVMVPNIFKETNND